MENNKLKDKDSQPLEWDDVIQRKKTISINLKKEDLMELKKHEDWVIKKLKRGFWYGVQCIGGKEQKILRHLKRTIIEYENDDFQNIFVCFKMKITKTKNGRTLKRTVNQHSGYFYIKMEMTDEAYRIVRSTPWIIAFIGEIKGNRLSKPQRMTSKDVDKDIAKFIKKPKVVTKEIVVDFEVGDYVEITIGVFEGYTAKVLAISKEAVQVSINMLGRDVESEVPLQSVKKI